MDLFLNVTLRGDVDLAFFGSDAEQRKKDIDPRLRILGIIDERGTNGMDEQEIYGLMEEEGYSRNKIEKTIAKLHEDGEIIERDFKFVRKV